MKTLYRLNVVTFALTYSISDDESIDNAFTKFNTIFTSLQALDETFPSVIKSGGS
jgi:hypothetical protein